jgi:hypothetical protein
MFWSSGDEFLKWFFTPLQLTEEERRQFEREARRDRIKFWSVVGAIVFFILAIPAAIGSILTFLVLHSQK